MESSLKNMILTLLVITGVSATAVGLVYGVTKAPIAAADAAKQKNAIIAVVPQFDNDPNTDAVTQTVDGMEVKIYTARMGSQTVGYAIETFSKNGFAGVVKLMVGLLPDGTINNISVLSHAETPGLGDKIEPKKSNFGAQYNGKNPGTFNLKVRKDGGEVDAITASTITSRAYSDAVQRAYDAFLKFAEQTQGASNADGVDSVANVANADAANVANVANAANVADAADKKVTQVQKIGGEGHE